jgi:HAD superfamily hydrolase (TIGR01509 family)
LRVTGGKERIGAYLRDDLGMDVAPWTTDIIALHHAKTARYVQLVADGALALRPGIPRIIYESRAQGLKLAVATTTSRANVDALARSCFGRDADDVFDVIAAGDEVAAKKPAPDIYNLALKRLGLPASVCLALEDAAAGIQAAKSAGLICVASPSTYLSGDDFGHADLVVREFSELTIEALRRLATSKQQDGA